MALPRTWVGSEFSERLGILKTGWFTFPRVKLPKEHTHFTPVNLRATRRRFRQSLSNKEEILNHIFNFTFAIAADPIISRLFCEPLGIDDQGPFLSLGREVLERYELAENVTQQDGLFVSDSAIIAVELKLGSKSWPIQIIKYAALMVLEEKLRQSGGDFRKTQLGLIFIVPNDSLLTHWNDVHLSGPVIDAGYLSEISTEKLDRRLKPSTELEKLLAEHQEQFVSVLDRLKLTVVSWTEFRDSIAKIERELDRSKQQGDQTLRKLLAGLRAQIDVHDRTGIPKSTDNPKQPIAH